jgi:hypothetical protein
MFLVFVLIIVLVYSFTEREGLFDFNDPSNNYLYGNSDLSGNDPSGNIYFNRDSESGKEAYRIFQNYNLIDKAYQDYKDIYQNFK